MRKKKELKKKIKMSDVPLKERVISSLGLHCFGTLVDHKRLYMNPLESCYYCSAQEYVTDNH